tara:strand:+ start:54 stop:1394 length:1341 start_codon:yes stop_codon:yes gene_type:complete
MSLKNIQRSKQKVLNRPMFAKMKDGTIKPVQYAQLGVFIQGGKYALPVLNRFGKYIVGKHGTMPYKESASRALTTIKNTLPSVIGNVRSGLPAIVKNPLSIFGRGKGKVPPSGAGKIDTPLTGTSVVPYNAQKGIFAGSSVPRAGGNTSYIPGIDRGTLLSTGTSLASLAALNNRGLFNEEETVTEKGSAPLSPGTGEGSYGRREQAFDEESAVPKGKKETKITEEVTEEIKSGGMDDMIKEKISLFEKYLGQDTDKRKKGAAYEAMVEFGLNLASARGGNTMDKIARSAKDPLKNFAAVGKEILNRAEKIKMAGVESGIQSYEKEQDREVDREAIAADVLVEQMKLESPKTDRLSFVNDNVQAILKDQTMRDNIISIAYDEDGNRKPEYVEKGISDLDIIQGVVDEMWKKGNATEIPSGDAGKELYTSLPSGTFVFYEGQYFTKP